MLKNSKELFKSLKSHFYKISIASKFTTFLQFIHSPEKLESILFFYNIDSCFLNIIKIGSRKVSNLVSDYLQIDFVKNLFRLSSQKIRRWYKKMLTFWLTTYLYILKTMSFNHMLAFPCAPKRAIARRSIFSSYEAEFFQRLLHHKREITRCAL